MSDEIQKQLDELKASNEALAAKNRELLGELKVSKAKAKGADIDPEDYARLQTELEDAKTALAKTEKTSKAEIEKLTKLASDRDTALQQHLIDGGLSEALSKVGVPPQFLDATKALLRGKAGINTDNGQYQAMLDGKPLHEAVTEWAASDMGKHFVAAQNNTGGGAAGASGQGSSKILNRNVFEGMNPAQQMTFVKEGGKVTD